MLTPYVGVGNDLVLAGEDSDVVELENEVQFAPHVLGGLELQVWHVSLGTEVQVAALTSFQVQVGAVF